jgi:RNA polymerase sigma-70 factor (ECF subfamily)
LQEIVVGYRKSSRHGSDTNHVESDWTNQIRAGSAEAFEHLFNRYCQVLIDFACRYLHDVPLAENMVQDVFLKIWQNRRQLDPGASIRSYLYTAVKNAALNHLRHTVVEQKSQDKIRQLSSEMPTPEDNWNEKELNDSIQKAIASLPDKCHEIFCLSRFDGLTYAEIAEVQNISVKTVETQMGRALKFLRKQLLPFLTISN